MKLATLAISAILIAGGAGPAAGQTGASQVAVAFTGGSTWTSPSTGICIWYLPLVGDLEFASLFNGPLFGAPVADREHSRFIWVSDFSVQVLPANQSFNLLALVPAGTATIYYTDRPDLRDWTDLTNRSTWGQPVATFARRAGLYQSADMGATDTFIFSADLVTSTPFKLNGQTFDFKDVIPHGMTCHETGVNGAEAGTCLAKGQ